MTSYPTPRRRHVWLDLPHTFSVFAVDSDLGRPGDVYVFVPSPHMSSLVCLEPRMSRRSHLSCFHSIAPTAVTSNKNQFLFPSIRWSPMRHYGETIQGYVKSETGYGTCICALSAARLIVAPFRRSGSERQSLMHLLVCAYRKFMVTDMSS